MLRTPFVLVMLLGPAPRNRGRTRRRQARRQPLSFAKERALMQRADRLSPANSWASGGSFSSGLPGTLEFSSGEVTILADYP